MSGDPSSSSSPDCNSLHLNDEVVPPWVENGGYIFLIIVSLYMFWSMTFLCEEYALPSITIFCKRNKIPEDIAGSLFIGTGLSLPVLFVTLIGLFVSQTPIGIGTVIGSDLFNHLVNIGLSIWVAPNKTLKISPWIVTREVICYFISSLLIIWSVHSDFFWNSLANAFEKDQWLACLSITWVESTVLVGAYVLYVIFEIYFDQLKNCLSLLNYFLCCCCCGSDDSENRRRRADVNPIPSEDDQHPPTQQQPQQPPQLSQSQLRTLNSSQLTPAAAEEKARRFSIYQTLKTWFTFQSNNKYYSSVSNHSYGNNDIENPPLAANLAGGPLSVDDFQIELTDLPQNNIPSNKIEDQKDFVVGRNDSSSKIETSSISSTNSSQRSNFLFPSSQHLPQPQSQSQSQENQVHWRNNNNNNNHNTNNESHNLRILRRAINQNEEKETEGFNLQRDPGITPLSRDSSINSSSQANNSQQQRPSFSDSNNATQQLLLMNLNNFVLFIRKNSYYSNDCLPFNYQWKKMFFILNDHGMYYSSVEDFTLPQSSNSSISSSLVSAPPVPPIQPQEGGLVETLPIPPNRTASITQRQVKIHYINLYSLESFSIENMDQLEFSLKFRPFRSSLRLNSDTNDSHSKKQIYFRATDHYIFNMVMYKLEWFLNFNKQHSELELQTLADKARKDLYPDLELIESPSQSGRSNHEYDLPYSSPELMFQVPPSIPSKITYYMTLPIKYIFYYTIPDVRNKRLEPLAFLAILMGFFWLAAVTYVLVIALNDIALYFNINPIIMGFTVATWSAAYPALWSSLIVAKNNFGDIAVYNALGSNVFNNYIGLGLPWLLYTLIYHRPYSNIQDQGVVFSILILLFVLGLFYVLLLITKFELKYWMTPIFISVYLGITGYFIYFTIDL